MTEGNLATASAVNSLMSAIRDVGRAPASMEPEPGEEHAVARGAGYFRPMFSDAEQTLREWFVSEATARGLDVHTDRNGIIWAWATPPGPNAVVTGSHLDSVPGGGEFDGPLGVASALAAVDVLRRRRVLPPGAGGNSSSDGATRPLAIAVFPEEEGSRFGVACLGSRLLTGATPADAALKLKDPDGLSFAQVAATSGLDPQHVGRDAEALALIGEFIELHVEQGRGLIDLGAPVAVADSIVGHGRWHITVTGQGNHAGTTPMGARHDPVVAIARLIGRIEEIAGARPPAVATVGRMNIHPNGTNVIAARADAWLDVRHPDGEVVAAIVDQVRQAGSELASAAGCGFSLVNESLSPTVTFDPELGRAMQDVLASGEVPAGTFPPAGGLAGRESGGTEATAGVPALPTGAGHDAGVLAAEVPTGMLFVRNPTGVSHAPEEACEPDDATAGVLALADVLADRLGANPPRVSDQGGQQTQ